MTLQYVQNSKLKVLQVSQIEGLRLVNTVEFADKKINIKEYFPTFKNQNKLPDRSWVCNLGKEHNYNEFTVSTLINQEFKSFFMKKVKENYKMVVNKKKLEMKVVPEFAALLRKTDSLSSNVLILILCYRGKRKIW